MMLQVLPDHQKNFQKSLMKNITSSSRSVETDTAISTLAEKNISLKGILEPDTQKIFSWKHLRKTRNPIEKEEILEQQSPNTSTDLPTVPFSDTSAIPAPFIFIKSDLRLVIDLQTCIKAQQSGAYAQKVKLTNLKQMAQTVAYIQEHGYDSLDDFHVELNQASDQTSAPRKSLKDTEQQLKDVNEQIEKVKDL